MSEEKRESKVKLGDLVRWTDCPRDVFLVGVVVRFCPKKEGDIFVVWQDGVEYWHDHNDTENKMELIKC